jgi:hypothetical protein
MHEKIVKKQKYLRIPDEIGTKITEDTTMIEKLSFHYCSNCNIKISDEYFPNLQFIEFIGNKYFEIELDFSASSKLKEIFMVATEYVDVMKISGSYPQFFKWSIDSCKYIKFKGQISSPDISLKTIKISNSPYVELFKSSVSLPNLHNLIFDNTPYLKIDLSKVKAPQLERIWFSNSNYISIISLGNITRQLKSFKFDNCTYPKLKNVDFAQLMQIGGGADVIPEDELDSGENQFRSVSIKKTVKTKRSRTKEDELFEEALKSAPSEEEAVGAANNFLDSLSGQQTSTPGKTSTNPLVETKFCPNCGNKNPIQAEFCAGCGNQFRV